MSKNESEHGTLQIPRGAYVSLRRAVAEAYNKERQKIFDAAVKAHASILAAGKGKRNFDFRAELRREEEKRVYRSFGYGGGYQNESTLVHLSFLGDDAHEHIYLIENLLFPRPKVDVKDATGRVLYQTTGEPPKKPVTPKKNAAGFKSPRDTRFGLGEACISFNDEQKTVTWDVPENNHAVERAHEHPVAKAFFKALSGIKWTRGTGGTFQGNDEYNQDSGNDYPGGGGSYVTATFGPPPTKAQQKRAAKFGGFGLPMRRFA